MPFRALHLSPQILQAVRDSGYTEPTPIQIAAIPLILAGDDVIGIAQTGTGKTAAFVLPILMKLAESRQTVARHGELTANQKHNVHRLRALVLAPTRELVVQIEENVRVRETCSCARGHRLRWSE
jgi:ATP-dependent RNA helicase RhlE